MIPTCLAIAMIATFNPPPEPKIVTLGGFASDVDGLLKTLPQDGAWATYDLFLTRQRDGRKIHQHMRVKVSSVGKTTDNGVRCRWIEMKLFREKPGKNPTFNLNALVWETALPPIRAGFPGKRPDLILKALFPDTKFRSDHAGFFRPIRAWLQKGDNAPVKVSDLATLTAVPCIFLRTGNLRQELGELLYKR